MNHYIYKITNKTTGEYYYGKRTAFDWKTDPYMGSGYLLKKKMDAHPEHEWAKEVLLLLDSAEEAYLYEAIIIGDKWRDDPLCLNLIAGGKGGGLTQAQLEERKERRLNWDLYGKLPEVEQISMSNDDLGIKTRVTNGPKAHDTIKVLIESGYDFSDSTSCESMTLAELGLSNYLSKEDILESLSNGIFPEVQNINLRNDDLETWCCVGAKSNLGVEGINQLLSNGWKLGRKNNYKRVKLSTVANGVVCNHEDRLLKGLPCEKTGMTMESPCKTKYVLLTQKPGRSYSKSCKKLYELGWAFGSSPTTQTKVKVREVLKSLAKPSGVPETPALAENEAN